MANPARAVTPAVAVTAIESNLFERIKLFRLWPHATVHDDPDMLWTITSIAFPLFNSVLRANLQDAEAGIDRVLARYSSRGVPLLWRTGPASRPVELGARLQARGFAAGERRTGMAMDLTVKRGHAIPRQHRSGWNESTTVKR